MREKKPDALQIWKQMEDLVVPRLRLGLSERAVYSFLLRHSHLEGTPRLNFSIGWLARGLCLCHSPARNAVRHLAEKGALKLVGRAVDGHTVDVLLPREIRRCRVKTSPAGANPDAADFMHNKLLRDSIHRREGGCCFYCFRALTAKTRTLDHVVPRVRRGRNSYRNLVSCCVDCNSQKGERKAEDFVRKLFRLRRLNPKEFNNRLRALNALAAGKLRPELKHLPMTRAEPWNGSPCLP